MITHCMESKLIMERTQNVQNYFLSRALICSKKIEETLIGWKISKTFQNTADFLIFTWNKQHNMKRVNTKIELTLIDQFKQNWKSTVHSSPKALN